jgi:hypothetical protein
MALFDFYLTVLYIGLVQKRMAKYNSMNSKRGKESKSGDATSADRNQVSAAHYLWWPKKENAIAAL